MFDDGFPNALELEPQVHNFGDRACVTDFLGPFPKPAQNVHPDEKFLGFLPMNADGRSLLLDGWLFGGYKCLSESLVDGVDDEE